MKCISLWQPWATLFLGLKRYETRHWHTHYRGPLLIHAAKRRDGFARQLFRTADLQAALREMGIVSFDHSIFEDLPFGKIIGKVDLSDCSMVVDDEVGNFSRLENGALITEPELSFGNFARGRFAWDAPKKWRFKEPIPFKGMQGFFNVPDDLVAEQLVKASAS